MRISHKLYKHILNPKSSNWGMFFHIEWHHYYRPHSQGCGKVMFSQVFVCPRGRVPLVSGPFPGMGAWGGGRRGEYPWSLVLSLGGGGVHQSGSTTGYPPCLPRQDQDGVFPLCTGPGPGYFPSPSVRTRTWVSPPPPTSHRLRRGRDVCYSHARGLSCIVYQMSPVVFVKNAKHFQNTLQLLTIPYTN